VRQGGLRHDGVVLSFQGQRHRIDLSALTGGKAITVYGQNEVVRDLIDARSATSRPLYFECDQVSVHDVDASPRIRFHHDGDEHEIDCDFIAGCDGFHGVCRASIPGAALTLYERSYPFGWLGILAEAAAIVGRARLHVSRARVCTLQHAIAQHHAALPAGASR
jgi:p-hydroxybenzoate 3-monooxygenase